MNGGEILLYIRNDIPVRLLSYSNETESNFAEINFRKKKCLISASYNLHKSNLSNHLHYLSKDLDNYIGNHDNIPLLGDFNLEFSEPFLNDFCDIYNLKNLVKEPTFYKNPDNPSWIEFFLTNRPRTFEYTSTIATAISDFHKLVVTFSKTFYKKQRLKIIHYINFKLSALKDVRRTSMVQAEGRTAYVLVYWSLWCKIKPRPELIWLWKQL